MLQTPCEFLNSKNVAHSGVAWSLQTFLFCYGNCSNLTRGKRPGNLGSGCVHRRTLQVLQINSSAENVLPVSLASISLYPNSGPEPLPSGEARPSPRANPPPREGITERKVLELSGKLTEGTKQREKIPLGQNQ